MSPVEILGTARCAAMNSACVPLPAPGGPTRTSLIRTPPGTSSPLGRTTQPRSLAQEPFVVALHELAFDLLHGLQADANHDQNRGAAEREVLQRLVAAHQTDEQVGQDRNDAQVQRAGKGD